MTYIPTRRGFLYLAALVDWYSRKGLGWQLSNARDAEACAEALKKALAKRATPEIFTTDQGSRFTSGDWIDVLTDPKVKISMGGKGRWIDNRGIDTHRVVPQGRQPQDRQPQDRQPQGLATLAIPQRRMRLSA